MATQIPTNRAQFTRAEVLAATRGNAIGPDWDCIVGVTTDSRRVEPGNLFVALRGERFDAHRFAAQAVELGATAVVVERGAGLPPNVSAIEVDDTLVALGDLARAHREAWAGQLIGITGSVGKTTTKTLAASALQAAGRRVHATVGNLNNRVGVPMTLLQLDDAVDTAVIEMGTSEPGEIPKLADIARPEAAIVTRASLAHTEGLGSIEAVADEKVSLLHALDPDGIAIAYGDDAPIKKRASVVAAKRKIFYGRGSGNDVRVLDWAVDHEATRARFQVQGHDIEVGMGLIGEGAVLNAAAVLALAHGLGISLREAAEGIATVKPLSGRMCALSGNGGRLVIDDSYNSNPAAIENALSTASVIAEQRKAPLIAVLGDMKELGAQSEEAHRRVGELVADAGVFLFVGCGEAMREAIAAAVARGVATLWFENSNECRQIADRLPLGAVVLVKGSRSMEMERTIGPLLGGEQP